MTSEFRPDEYRRREVEVCGFPVRVTSYRLGSTFHCTVDNVSPGAVISRSMGDNRESAEERALESATARLETSARRKETLRKLRGAPG
jgi:hypothetical protein